MQRHIEQTIADFFDDNPGKALLLTGARQVGKTYIIRKYLAEHASSWAEINFLENQDARALFLNAKSSKDILNRLSLLTETKLVPGETVLFFDEVQEAKELVTAIKFLVEDGNFRYILSGSLLGVELKDIRSIPVGYMEILELFPLDFEEFCIANGVSAHVIDTLRENFLQKQPVDELIHTKMMELFRLYLIVGGMPAVVNIYLQTNNLRRVIDEQKSIHRLYKQDIAKYDPDDKLYLEEIFDLIPSELNSKNKRFVLKNLNENFKFSRYAHSFIWLKDAGVALPTYCVREPKLPLLLSKSTNLFKLFLSDVGLLAGMYAENLQIRILKDEADINYGAIYENAAAQELRAHGFPLYYFNSKKQGELDFVVEYKGQPLPIEIKSGKDYAKHSALHNVLANPLYNIPAGYVFCSSNVETQGKIVYYPIYMLTFLRKDTPTEDFIYKPDLHALTD